MPTFKLTIEYDGAPFHGWQIQPDRPTVQGLLAAAIRGVTGEEILPTGASRTDAGVHARGQVASFASATRIPAARLGEALNAHLPEEIACVRSEVVPDGFDARRDATGKWYRYRVVGRRSRSPIEARTAWWRRRSLDASAVAAAARLLVGRHDFAAFATKVDHDKHRPPTTVRTIRSIDVRREGDLIEIDVRGDGFLYNMVRAIAGTLVRVGEGRTAPEEIAAVLASRDRRRAGPNAPPHGLCLMEVEYLPPCPLPGTHL